MACSDPASASDAGTSDAAPASDASTPTGAALGAVPVTLEGTLDPAKSCRLVVLFAQFDDDFAAPPLDVVHDVPFDPTKTTIELPALRAPAAANVVCARKDKERGKLPGACDADSPYHFALGYVLVVEDGNKNGKADFTTNDGSAEVAAPDAMVRMGFGAVVYDEKGGSVLPKSESNPPLIEGTVPAGFSLYEAHRPTGSSFDRLRARTKELVLAVEGPNLS